MSRDALPADATVCHACVGDRILSDRVQARGKAQICDVCRARRRCVVVSELGAWLREALGLAIQPGGVKTRVHPTRGVEVVQDGHSLGSWIQSLIGLRDERLTSALVHEVTSPGAGAGAGDTLEAAPEAPFAAETPYVRTTGPAYRIEAQWRAIEDGLPHRFRFFDNEARDFLDALLADLHHQAARHMPAWPPRQERGKDGARAMTSAIRQLAPGGGWSIFRARMVPSRHAFENMAADGARAWGPPPSERASAGRLNAEGVAVFHGASDRQTGLAELRPHAGALVATAEFRLSAPVTVLDFNVLEAVFRAAPQSIFDPSYASDLGRRTGLQSLHRLIREPTHPGQERRYLRTQVLAGYLATQHRPRIQGVVFSSALNEAGTNLVLFPAAPLEHVPVLGGDLSIDGTRCVAPSPLDRFPLKFVERSARLHRVRGIRYDVESVASRDDEDSGLGPSSMTVGLPPATA